jgi:DNA repair protein SbcC/Rad50
MRPLKLSLEGFTSFRDRQNLDFSDLELFAITGQTGSGKTSLLDAITFALYGKVARKLTPKELVSQGKENLKVELSFQVGGKDYRVIRTWRYRPSNPETQFLLEVWEGQKWELLNSPNKDASDILGMDFETFTRVILLPQGQFAEFLTGEARDRRKILRQLIPNFQIFESMRDKASQEAKRYEGSLAEVKAQLAGLEIPKEEIRLSQDQFNVLKADYARLEEAIEQAQQQIMLEEQLLTSIRRLEELKHKLNSLKTESSKFDLLKQKLLKAQVANLLQSIWVLVQEGRNTYETAVKDAQTSVEKLTHIKIEVGVQEQKLNDAKAIGSKLKANEEALTAAGSHEQRRVQFTSEVSQAEHFQSQRQAQLVKDENALQIAKTEVSTAEEQIQLVEREIGQYASVSSERLMGLQKVLVELPNWERLTTQVKRSQKELDAAISTRAQEESTFKALVTKLEHAERVLQTTRTVLKQAETDYAVTALRKSLHAGESCPVCNGLYPGETLLPEISTVDLSQLEQQVKNAEHNYKKVLDESTNVHAKLAASHERESSCREGLQEQQADLAKVNQQIREILLVEFWDAEALKQEHKVLLDKEKRHTQALQKQQAALANLREKQQTFQFAQQTYETASSEYKLITDEVARRKSQLQEAVQILDDALANLRQVLGNRPYQELKRLIEQQRQTFDPELEAVERAFNSAETWL